MHFDQYTKKGDHPVCEDNTFIDINKKAMCVSDGCSSSENTDFGSKILSRLGIESFPKEELSSFYYRNIGLSSPESYDATLLSFKLRDWAWQVSFFGDGHVIYKNKDSNEIEVVSVEYSDNAPFYLSYYLPNRGYDEYMETYGHQKVIITRQTLGTDKICRKELPLLDVLNNGESNRYVGTIESTSWVLICSDGIESLKDKKGNDTSTIEVIERLSDFKSLKGKFVQRKLNRILKEYSKENISNYDDIGITGVCFDE